MQVRLPRWADIKGNSPLFHDVVLSTTATIQTDCDLTLYRVPFPIEYHDLMVAIVDEINAENEGNTA